ncbi:MAG: hypothetical protein L0Y60_09830 [Beijerinckiaceae bacterium]|nr:hypothetical protein [Beijerinckiaceae bacterium]
MAKHARAMALTIDHGLAALGLAAAASSAAFAFLMITQESRGTVAERREDHLRLTLSASARSDYAPIGSIPFFGQPIDYNATGSIPKRRGRSSVLGSEAATTGSNAVSARHARTGDYAVSFVHKDMALVKSERGLYAARRGMILPNAGQILSIERRGDKWFLLTDRTIINEAD